MKLRRNMVVSLKSESWTLYGRINRILDENYVEIIDCGKYFRKVHKDDIEVHDYQGYWYAFGELREQFPVYYRMPSLRKLKQITRVYDPFVWKKNRYKGQVHIYNRSDELNYFNDPNQDHVKKFKRGWYSKE